MILRAARRLFGLPAPRCGSTVERCFVPMRDGVRLATWHFWPVNIAAPPGTIVIRTPYGVGGPRSLLGIASRILAESGYHVIVQDVRGRYRSEGQFVPFVHEREDGADTLRWIAEQSWSNGPVGLFGLSYLAYTAWCAMAEAPEHVGALVSVIGSGDLYGIFYRGGALSLLNTFEWGLGLGEREGLPARDIDLARGTAHRPVREGDRVALRTVDWVRDWIDHPRRDAFWKQIAAELPDSIPPILSIAGWYDFFLERQLCDHAEIVEAATKRGGPLPRLVIGPWAHGVPARLGWWRESLLGHALREGISHFDRYLLGERQDENESAVRFFVAGRDTWRDADRWPPAGSANRILFLHARGSRGVIDAVEPENTEPTLRFRHDPDRPLPTLGGALFGIKAGIKDQRPIATRSDVILYDSEPIEHDLTINGPVRLCLHVETDAEDVDLTARLIDLTPRGRDENICDGIQRVRWRNTPPGEETPAYVEPGVVTPLTIELGNAARTIRAGHRLRVVVGASNFPRFDRNPGTRETPALAKAADFRATEQIVHHGGTQRSWLELCAFEAGTTTFSQSEA